MADDRSSLGRSSAMSNLSPAEEYELAVIRWRFRVGLGFVFGAIVGVVINVWMRSSSFCSEADSSFCAFLIWIVLIPLLTVTLAFLWLPLFQTHQVSWPWSFILQAWVPVPVANAIGLTLNMSILFGVLSYWRERKRKPKDPSIS